MWRPFARIIRSLTGRRHHDDLWSVARELSPVDLRSEAEEEDDVFSLRASPPRFVGYYTAAGIDRALRAYGIDQEVRRRGFRDLGVDVRQTDPFTSTLRVYGRTGGAGGGEEDAGGHLICETRCRLGVLPRPEWLSPDARRHLRENDRTIFIEWMLLQNPTASFTPERPCLTGQVHPGLGLGNEVMEILRILGWRLRVAAFVQNPVHPHNAILYSRKFVFLEPERQGFFLALLRAARGRPLQQITLAVDNGYLHDDETGDRLAWEAAAQVSPLARPLIRLYRSRAYADAVHRELARTTLRFDWEAYDRVHAQLAAALPEDRVGG